MCREHGVDLAAIAQTPTANFGRIAAINAAADRLMHPEAVKRGFLTQAALVNGLYRAVKPHPLAVQFAERCVCIQALADRVKTRQSRLISPM